MISLLTLLPKGFQHKDFKERFAQLLGPDPSQITQGKMSYQLRRLRLHGLIERQTGTHRYPPASVYGSRISIREVTVA